MMCAGGHNKHVGKTETVGRKSRLDRKGRRCLANTGLLGRVREGYSQGVAAGLF